MRTQGTRAFGTTSAEMRYSASREACVLPLANLVLPDRVRRFSARTRFCGSLCRRPRDDSDGEDKTRSRRPGYPAYLEMVEVGDVGTGMFHPPPVAVDTIHDPVFAIWLETSHHPTHSTSSTANNGLNPPYRQKILSRNMTNYTMEEFGAKDLLRAMFSSPTLIESPLL